MGIIPILRIIPVYTVRVWGSSEGIPVKIKILVSLPVLGWLACIKWKVLWACKSKIFHEDLYGKKTYTCILWMARFTIQQQRKKKKKLLWTFFHENELRTEFFNNIYSYD